MENEWQKQKDCLKSLSVEVYQERCVYLHVCRITWMTIATIVQITLASGKLWRTKQERKGVTSAYRKWWTRGSYRWDIWLSLSTSTDRVELPKFHRNISWWMMQKILIRNTLHHLGKIYTSLIKHWGCQHLCVNQLYAVADPRGASPTPAPPHPPTDQNFLNFM